MDPLWIFIYGFIGGCAPELVRVWKIARGVNSVRYSKSLLLLSLAVAVLGGVLAVAFESPNPLNAIWVGASTPIIISDLAKIPLD